MDSDSYKALIKFYTNTISGKCMNLPKVLYIALNTQKN